MTSADDLFPACAVDAGCFYLRDLSRLERLIGCDPTAKFYERTADRCSRDGCWALLLHHRELASPSSPRRPRFPFKASRGATKANGHGPRVIPLVRSDVADVVSDDDGNFVERRLVKAATLDPREPLGYMYDYWRWLRSMTRCQMSNIDTTHLMRARIIGKLHVVDVASADPEEFRFDLLGYGIPLGPGYTRPRDHHSALYADSVLRDYNTVRLTAAPRLQQVRFQVGSIYYNYRRLILPLFDECRNVTRLLVGIHQEPGDGAKVERR